MTFFMQYRVWVWILTLLLNRVRTKCTCLRSQVASERWNEQTSIPRTRVKFICKWQRTGVVAVAFLDSRSWWMLRDRCNLSPTWRRNAEIDVLARPRPSTTLLTVLTVQSSDFDSELWRRDQNCLLVDCMVVRQVWTKIYHFLLCSCFAFPKRQCFYINL